MEKPLFQLSQDLMRELDIREDSIKVSSFQGEICTVFNAYSSIHGPLVIKTAVKAMQISEAGQTEIRQNKEGYLCIPNNFRPEIIASDQENTFLVMPNVGKPLRDLLWETQNSSETSLNITRFFLENLSRLFKDTVTYDIEARNAFLDKLQNMGQNFLRADIFPQQLRSKFNSTLGYIKRTNDRVVALATLDFTQGNLLIDTKRSPQTLKVIDPQQPRLVRDAPTFLGIPEVDLGMYIVTLSLNAPNTVQDLKIEEKLRNIGRGLWNEACLSDLSFDLGKLFGCVLVASFPNTLERVEIYFKSVGANFDEGARNSVIRERERHIQEATKIANNMELI